jgi:flagellar basal-body rod protein FlgF
MGDGIYTALSGALAQQHSLDVIANNVANANTAGFRADRVVFGELLAGAQREQQPVDPRQPTPPRTDQFVRVEENTLDRSNGVLRHTGNPLDLAIQGDGYFVVRTNEGDRLTRAGNFMLRESGELSTMEGHTVLSKENTPIMVPHGARNIEVTPEGLIRATLSDGSTRGHVVDIAQLSLKSVNDPRGLTREGTTLYKVGEGAQISEPARAEIAQGHLEASNVNPVSGLNELITVSRSFDALHKVIETFQQLDQRTARDVGSRNG